MTNYPVGDFLIRLGNAALAGKREVTMTSTKLIKNVAIALKKAGYLAEVEDKKGNPVCRNCIPEKEFPKAYGEDNDECCPK